MKALAIRIHRGNVMFYQQNILFYVFISAHFLIEINFTFDFILLLMLKYFLITFNIMIFQYTECVALSHIRVFDKNSLVVINTKLLAFNIFMTSPCF